MAARENPLSPAAKLLVRQLDELGAITDEAGRLTRTFLSPAMKQANRRVSEWMREAGLTARQDAVGNVIGRLASRRDGAPTLLLGSHLDTVRNAGRFDGPLGVLLPIAALGELRRNGVELPFAVEVVGFAEEEGVRFSLPYIGSKGFIGQLNPDDFARRDAEGISLAEAIRAGTGSTRGRLLKTAPRDLIGYVEVHIEQGPVLENEGLAVGTVSGIASQRRGQLVFLGRAGHAGTTPMKLRRDALAGAAEFIVAAERLARANAALVATVGLIEVPGGAGNVIPGEVRLSLDVRHPSAERCKAAVTTLRAMAKDIAARRGLRCVWQETLRQPATLCSTRLTSLLAASTRKIQGRNLSLVSGAGHDAVVLAEVTDVAILFVRCRAGLSHHPDEYAAPTDLDVALRVMVDFLIRLTNDERALQPRRRTVTAT